LTPGKRKTGAAGKRRGGSSIEPRELDPVTWYATEVAAKRIVAGPYVRGACKRHLRDLKTGHLRGLYFDPAAAEDFFAYCREVLTVLKDGKVVPFELEPSQKFKTGSVFGWKCGPGNHLGRKPGARRFRTVYIEEGKGNGKSPEGAAVGLYCMTSDGEARAEVYAGASSKKQAMILFKDAVDMRAASDDLLEEIVASGVNPVYKLSHPKTGSKFEPISSEDGQSGPRPSCALCDEVHEHKDSTVIDMLEAGFKFRHQPILWLITNSGHDRQSVCYEYHERGVRACTTDVIDDTFFAYVCSLDPGDDPLEDESCWVKANPCLDATITREYIRGRVNEARKLPSKQNIVLRLNFCVWTEADSAWMARDTWSKAEVGRDHEGKIHREDVEIEDFAGAQGFLATDLSFARDLTAVAAAFPDGDDVYLFVDYWTPRDTISARTDKDRVPYAKWSGLENDPETGQPARAWITATPGKVVQLPSVADRLRWYDETFDIAGYAYDRYRHKDLDDQLVDLGLDPLVEKMIEHPQGFRRASVLRDRRTGKILEDDTGQPLENPLWMPTSVEELENGILEGWLKIRINPVLRWNASAAIVREDPAGTGGRVFNKLKATGRIDGLVAGAMAVGLAKARRVKRKSIDDFLKNPVVSK
jgi:phage terminase large subunit-like protein